ncbi:hypothetical protein O1L60_22300 [Streptomyces diastatochromogenes]|nr:hypothetical protein [Streptomyces diastatochromogenes]
MVPEIRTTTSVPGLPAYEFRGSVVRTPSAYRVQVKTRCIPFSKWAVR